MRWTLKQVLTCLIGSTSVTLGLSLGAYMAWKNAKMERLSDHKTHITSLIQTGPEKEALKSDHLLSLLGLSWDRPTSLYAFNCRDAEQKLMASPWIKKARIQRIPPGSLYIEYEIRYPVAWLAEYRNLAVDAEGFVFPVAPFLSPKEMPEIYLGLPPFGAPEDGFGRKGASWNCPVNQTYFQLALEMIRYFQGQQKEDIVLKKVDVSNAFAPSLGKREVVLFTEEEVRFYKNNQEIVTLFPKILRLSPRDYVQQLNHFTVLRKNMIEDYRKQLAHQPYSSRFSPRIIDLRIPQLAFIENH